MLNVRDGGPSAGYISSGFFGGVSSLLGGEQYSHVDMYRSYGWAHFAALDQ